MAQPIGSNQVLLNVDFARVLNESRASDPVQFGRLINSAQQVGRHSERDPRVVFMFKLHRPLDDPSSMFNYSMPPGHLGRKFTFAATPFTGILMCFLHHTLICLHRHTTCALEYKRFACTACDEVWGRMIRRAVRLW